MAIKSKKYHSQLKFSFFSHYLIIHIFNIHLFNLKLAKIEPLYTHECKIYDMIFVFVFFFQLHKILSKIEIEHQKISLVPKIIRQF